MPNQVGREANAPSSIEDILVLGNERASSALNDGNVVGKVGRSSRKRRTGVDRVVGVGRGEVNAEAVGDDIERRSGEVRDGRLARDGGVVPDEVNNVPARGCERVACKGREGTDVDAMARPLMVDAGASEKNMPACAPY